MAKKERSKEIMLSFTFRIPSNLIDELRDKAGSIPMSVIIRRLIEKYIKGEVGLD